VVFNVATQGARNSGEVLARSSVPPCARCSILFLILGLFSLIRIVTVCLQKARNPLEYLQEDLDSGLAEERVLRRRTNPHDFAIDLKGVLSPAEYERLKMELSEEELKNARERYWEDPSQVEGYDRFEFASMPNTWTFDALSWFAPSLLRLLV